MTSARDRIHIKYCNDGGCELGAGDDLCKNLDYLLDAAEDDRVHAEVHRILDISMDTTLMHGSQVTQGLGLAIKTIDPYVLRDGQLTRKSDGKRMRCKECSS